jgi:hypothetical protein
MARFFSTAILSLVVLLLSTMMTSTEAFAQAAGLFSGPGALGLDSFLCNGEDTISAYQTICNFAQDLANVTLPQAPVEEEEAASGSKDQQDEEFEEVGPVSRRKLIRGV